VSLRSELIGLDSHLWEDELVRLRPISCEKDIIYATIDCALKDGQQELVNPAWFSICRAYLSPEDNYPCLICTNNGEPIGFISLCKWLGDGDAYSWSFFIDASHQGKGYGRHAALVAVRLLKSASGKAIKLATEEDNGAAQHLYESLGFKLLPERDGDDLVYSL